MYINTYVKRNKSEVINTIEALELSLKAFNNLKDKGFKTINEAFKSVIGKQVTKREYKKFAALLGDNITFLEDTYSANHLDFVDSSKSYQGRVSILRLTLRHATDSELFTINRHHTIGSLNLEEHTIESLIADNSKALAEYKKQFKLIDSVESRIANYESDLEQAIKDLQEKHISDIKKLVNSKSI